MMKKSMENPPVSLRNRVVPTFSKGGAGEIFLLSLLISAVLITSGCAVTGSRVPDTAADVPASFSTGSRLQGPPLGRWWEQFEDIRLNILMEEAFRYNLDIAKAYERYMQSMANVSITGSAKWVNLNIEGSGGRSRGLGVEADTYSLSASASYELDLWKKAGSVTDASRFDAFASEEDLKAAYISISAQLADLYYLAVEQRLQMELSDRVIASFQETLDRVERRYSEGLVPAIDVYQSRQGLAGAKAQRPVFESTLAVTVNSLSVLLGRFPGKDIKGDIKELKDIAALETGLPSQLLKRRPDIRAALLRVRAGDRRAAAAVADRFPSFNLIGSYGGTSQKLKTVLNSPNILWNVLLQAAQPVLDGGRRKAEVARSEAAFREDLIAYHSTVLNAFKEVEDALVRISTSEKRIAMFGEIVSASENSLRLALERYMQGLTDYLPVLSEQQRHFDAKSRLLSARRQLISDRIQLARALGGEWVDEVMNEYKTGGIIFNRFSR